jgi:integrase
LLLRVTPNLSDLAKGNPEAPFMHAKLSANIPPPVLPDDLALDEPPYPDEPLILLTDRGLPWEGRYLSRMMWRTLPKIDTALAGLNIHGFRKLAAASLAEAGCTEREIASITGHESLAMVQLYTRSVRREQLATVAIGRLTTARDNRQKPPA